MLVVLTAGASLRLGEPKALARAAGRAAIDVLIEAAGLDEVVVVTGAHREEIEAHLGAPTLFNPEWEAGRSGGLALAARANPGRDLCVAPVDHAGVAPETCQAMKEAWAKAGAPARGWLAPQFGDRFGHPILLGAGLAAEVETLSASAPLRDLRAQADPLLSVPVDDPGVVLNVDTPADLAQLHRILSGRSTDR